MQILNLPVFGKKTIEDDSSVVAGSTTPSSSNLRTLGFSVVAERAQHKKNAYE